VTTRLAFDERAVLCDNPGAVNHLRRAVITTLLVLTAAAGCDKTNDAPRLKDEAQATAKEYQRRIDELAQRAEAIGKRARALPPSSLSNADARRVYGRAQAALGQLRARLTQGHKDVELAAAANDTAKLFELIDTQRDLLDRGIRELIWDLAAVEAWVALAEQQPDAAIPPGDAAPVQ
jgi:hypothetical protein